MTMMTIRNRCSDGDPYRFQKRAVKSCARLRRRFWDGPEPGEEEEEEDEEEEERRRRRRRRRRKEDVISTDAEEENEGYFYNHSAPPRMTISKTLRFI